MKAILYHKYGSPEVLKLEEIDKPIPKANEVLIKVRAASVNSWDWDLLRGKPYIVRLIGGGFSKPKMKILGCDLAGVVETIGENVKHLKLGDKVLGDVSAGNWGAFAEYVCAREDSLTIKRTSLTFEQAASLPQAGVMALQGIRDHGKVKAGQKVLINGAGGGVGTFAIQLAKLYGADVTGVDREEKFKLMSAIGADHVIDFMKEDFTKNGKQYDLILDVVGHHSIFDYKRALKSEGIYRMIGGQASLIFQSLLLGPLISLFGNKKMGILGHEVNKDLDHLLNLIETGKIKPIIDGNYQLSEVPLALKRLGEGLIKGKAVITI